MKARIGLKRPNLPQNRRKGEEGTLVPSKGKINQFNEKGQKEGYWEVDWGLGTLYYKGYYKNGRKEGLWEDYWDNGELFSKGYYKNGLEEGLWIENYDALL